MHRKHLSVSRIISDAALPVNADEKTKGYALRTPSLFQLFPMLLHLPPHCFAQGQPMHASPRFFERWR